MDVKQYSSNNLNVFMIGPGGTVLDVVGLVEEDTSLTITPPDVLNAWKVGKGYSLSTQKAQGTTKVSLSFVAGSPTVAVLEKIAKDSGIIKTLKVSKGGLGETVLINGLVTSISAQTLGGDAGNVEITLEFLEAVNS